MRNIFSVLPPEMCTVFEENCPNREEKAYVCISESAAGRFKKPQVALELVHILLQVTSFCTRVLGSRVEVLKLVRLRGYFMPVADTKEGAPE